MRSLRRSPLSESTQDHLFSPLVFQVFQSLAAFLMERRLLKLKEGRLIRSWGTSQRPAGGQQILTIAVPEGRQVPRPWVMRCTRHHGLNNLFCTHVTVPGETLLLTLSNGLKFLQLNKHQHGVINWNSSKYTTRRELIMQFIEPWI